MKAKTTGAIVTTVVTLVFVVATAGSLFETNMAGYLQVKQAAMSGTLSCRVEPGMYWQGFGTITTYKEAETFSFEKTALPTRFNDGTKAQVTGSFRVLLPRDCPSLLSLHRLFHGMDGAMRKLVYPAAQKALFSTGPHMSAGQSYAERRGEFASLAEDQLKLGVITTDRHAEMQPDPITGEEKQVYVLEKKSCEKGERCLGGYERDESAFSQFSMDITNFVIKGITYPDVVLAQIETQRKARMNVITQQAEAKEAEARESKARAEGKAKVQETRATEEVAKTQRVVRAEAAKAEAILIAEKKKAEAKLDAEAALLEKKANIARGEGEAARKRLVMQADGALAQKLDAWVSAQRAYATALASAKPGALVPTVVMGGNGAGKGSADQWMTLMMAKSAKDLALDMAPKK